MMCPRCGSYNSKCTDTVQYTNYRRRINLCKDCNLKFITKEFITKVKDPKNGEWREVKINNED